MFDKLRAWFHDVAADKRVLIREGKLVDVHKEAVFIFDCKICNATWSELTEARYFSFVQSRECYGLSNCPTKNCPNNKSWRDVHSYKLFSQQ